MKRKPTYRDVPAWTPFQRATLIPMTPEHREALIDDALHADPSLTREQAAAVIDDLDNDVIAKNSRYQVNIRGLTAKPPFGRIVHLSIKRLDKERVGRERYRDFMRIRDELIGPQFEAVEIYPPRSDEVDTANQYHLWVFLDRDFRLPFGWHGQRLVSSVSPVGGKQEPLE